MRRLAVITRLVVHRRGDRQRAFAQVGKIGGRDVERPGAVVCHKRSVGFTAQRDGHRLACFRAGRAVYGERLLGFRRIQHIVARQRVHANHRRGGVHADGVRRRGAVPGAVLRRNRNLVARAVGQGAHVGGRYGGCPGAIALDSGRIALTIQGDSDLRTAGELRAGAVDDQRRPRFCRIDHVIAAEGVDGQRDRCGIYHHVMGLGAAVARAVGDCRAEGHGAVGQGRNVAGRNAHAPFATGVNGGGVLVRTYRDDQLIADAGTGCGAADDLRLPVLNAVDDVIARHDVKADGRRRGIERNRFARAARVTRGVTHAHLHGVAVIRQSGQIGGRHVNAPDAALLNLCGIAVSTEVNGYRLTDFSRGGAGNGHARSRFAAVDHVIAGYSVNGHGWRRGIDAVLPARRRAVAVHIGHAHLHAGVAVFQTRKIRGRHGGRPVAVGIDFDGVRLTAEGDGHGLVFLHVRGAAGQHQIRAFFCRVNHVVGSNRINTDSDCRQIHRHVMTDGHRIARRALACNGHGNRARSQGPDVCCRDRRAPGTVCQHGGRIGFAIDGHGERSACRQSVAGAGDNQVLSMLDAVNHIVARDGIHAQARQAGVDSDIALARSRIAMVISDGC